MDKMLIPLRSCVVASSDLGFLYFDVEDCPLRVALRALNASKYEHWHRVDSDEDANYSWDDE